MSEEEIKAYYERIEKLLNGANKETYGFAPQEIKNILRSHEILGQENQELKKQKEEWIDLLNMFKTQQKEFIEWLESKNFLGQIPVEQVFSKYKEIIGDK